jgi:hypothetical protein
LVPTRQTSALWAATGAGAVYSGTAFSAPHGVWDKMFYPAIVRDKKVNAIIRVGHFRLFKRCSHVNGRAC